MSKEEVENGVLPHGESEDRGIMVDRKLLVNTGDEKEGGWGEEKKGGDSCLHTTRIRQCTHRQTNMS
mgnify:FL=1